MRVNRAASVLFVALGLTFLPGSSVLAKKTTKELGAKLTVVNVEGCPIEIQDDTKMGPPAIKQKTIVRDLGNMESWAATGRGARYAGDEPGWLLWAYVKNASERKVTEVQLRWVFRDEAQRPFGESVQVIDLGRGLKPGKRIDDYVMIGDLPGNTKIVTVEPFLVKFDDGSGWNRKESLAVATPK